MDKLHEVVTTLVSTTAESPPREVIDLTDNSEDDVLDLSSEEERQAREEVRRGVLTFHTEVERARADPAPEYEAPPPVRPT